MRTNRILLTSLSNQGDRKSHRYFYYADDGVYRYCDGLSVAEAGAKYILSEVNIDEIIVLGAGRTYDPGEENKRIELRSWSDFTSKDAKDLSEYSFFQYRLAQFLDNIDMEALDVLADLDPKRQEELKRGYDAFISEIQGEPGYRPDRVFHMISRDSRFYDLLMTKVDIASEHELLWLERFFYTKLAETMKMVCREDNEDIRICFIPTSRDRTNNSVPAENVAQIIKVINASDADEIEIYMDMQGLASAEGYTILGLLTMLGNDVNNRISVKEIITSHYSRGRFANPIDNNEMKRYEINSLVSGMDAFIRYGKVDEMLKYWQTRGIENKHIDSLLYAMHRVDEGISLCNTSDLESGINMLKYVFNNTPMEELHEVETNIFRILEDTIRNDYGKLLEEGDLDPLELVKWAMRKKFYQQSLTIIESRAPREIVESGMFCYAVDEESRKLMLDNINEYYWKTQPKDRWQFNDIGHWYVKYYGKDTLPRNNRATDRQRDYVDNRLDQIGGGSKYLPAAYSSLAGNKQLLGDVLYAYYNIGQVRNKINHAEENETSTKIGSLDEVNPNIKLLIEGIEKYVSAMEAARAYAAEHPEEKVIPVEISTEELKSYANSHRLNPDRPNRGFSNKFKDRKNRDGEKEKDKENSSPLNGAEVVTSEAGEQKSEVPADQQKAADQQNDADAAFREGEGKDDKRRFFGREHRGFGANRGNDSRSFHSNSSSSQTVQVNGKQVKITITIE